jgi:hypothetical protein
MSTVGGAQSPHNGPSSGLSAGAGALCRWWDVLRDEKRTSVIIEGNSHTGVHVLQVDGGLPEEPARAAFLRKRDVMSGDIRARLRRPAASNLLCRSM